MYQTIDPYHELANAIIVSASRDYMKVYKKYLRTGLGYERVTYEEHFFFSDWFGVLSDANPEYLVDQMRKKCEMEVEEEGDTFDDDLEEEFLDEQ